MVKAGHIKQLFKRIITLHGNITAAQDLGGFLYKPFCVSTMQKSRKLSQ